ncbi:hypothetical protein U8326_04100 [Tsuneonella sp. CC-YZS046]|uniref:hypothetical protein n=1 Tax=Tsuneonella sp. CC-YZS046 TaxID=3042152 RepID=UPI002D78BD8D|nr:hypothetical protein [Tsuneonella sp. CC-YZS046]WRO67359.1 hypothetical protein U8326_04100 [Tsuneonella sp. CC-YZS046]
MNRASLAAIIAITLGGLTGACAGDSGRYPSLAIREAERVEGTAQAVEPEEIPAPETPSQDLVTRLEQLKSEADRAHKAFMAAAPGAERQVSAASGAAVASDAWTSAQVAIANLEASRSRLLIALAQLDSLHVTAELEGGARSTISDARNQVDQMAETENEIIARLLGRIRG